jgi:hypothetical protein
MMDVFLVALLRHSFVDPVVVGVAQHGQEESWSIDKNIIVAVFASFDDTDSYIGVFGYTSCNNETSSTYLLSIVISSLEVAKRTSSANHKVV